MEEPAESGVTQSLEGKLTEMENSKSTILIVSFVKPEFMNQNFHLFFRLHSISFYIKLSRNPLAYSENRSKNLFLDRILPTLLISSFRRPKSTQVSHSYSFHNFFNVDDLFSYIYG
jgi:hypothetical protein